MNVVSGSKWGKVGDFMFMGEYRHTVDEKGRLTIPSKVRSELGETFVLTRGLDNCLAIYPSDEWSNIISEYKKLPNTRDARNFKRFFLASAQCCEFDKQGRINITDSLIKYASLEKDVIIVGVDDHLEVWSKNHWEDFIDENECNFSDIADKLFSPKLD